MRPDYIFSVLALGILANNALAEVTDAAANGFSLTHEVTIHAARADVWVAAVDHVVNGGMTSIRLRAVPLH